MRSRFPALPRLLGAADPHPLSCRCFAKEVRSSQRLRAHGQPAATGAGPFPPCSWDIPEQGRQLGPHLLHPRPSRAPVTPLLLGWLCHRTGRVEGTQRSHTTTPGRLLMIHFNTKIAQSASCSTQYPQRIMLRRFTFLNQQDEAATPQREEFSRMSLILKCPDQYPAHSPLPAGHELPTNATASPQPFLCSSYIFPLPTSLLHS